MDFQRSYRLLCHAAKNMEVKKKDDGKKKKDDGKKKQVATENASEKRKQDVTKESTSEKKAKIVFEDDDDIIILEDTRTNGVKPGSTKSKTMASVTEASSAMSAALKKPESSTLTRDLVDLSTPPKMSEGSVLTSKPHVVYCARSNESPACSESTFKSSALTGDIVDLSTPPKESKGSVSTADPHIADCIQSDEPPVFSKSTAEPVINEGTQSSHQEGSTSIVKLDAKFIQKKDLHDSSGNDIQSSDREGSASIVELDAKNIQRKDVHDPSGDGVQSKDQEGSSSIIELGTECILKKDLHDSSGDVTQDSSGDATQDSSGDVTQDSSGDATHDSSGDATQDSSGDATQDSSGNVTQDSSGNVTQDSSGDATQDSSEDGILSNHQEASASIIKLKTKCIQKKDLLDSSINAIQSNDREGSSSVVKLDTECIQKEDMHESSDNDTQSSNREGSASIVDPDTECIQKKDMCDSSDNDTQSSNLEGSASIVKLDTECIQKKDLHGPSANDIQSSDLEGSASIVDPDTECIQKKDLHDASVNTELCPEESNSSVVHTDSATNIEPNVEDEEQEDSEVCNVEQQQEADDVTSDEENTTKERSCDREESVGQEQSEHDEFEYVEEIYFTDPSAPDRSKSDYYCDLCDAHMNNLKMWESHVNGKRHTKNLKKEPGERSSHIKYVLKEDAIPLIQYDLDKVSEPVIGLQFICEYQRSGFNPMYSCFLCGGSMVKSQILEHVWSTKHRLHFFKEVEPEAALLFENVLMNKDAKENLLCNKAVEWEDKHGRGKMEVRVENKKDLSPRYATTNGNRSFREDRTTSRRNRSRSSLRRKSPDLERDRYSPVSRRDRFSSGEDNPEYESRRDRYSHGSRRDRYSPDFQRRTSPDFGRLRDSPDRTSPSSRRAYRERSPYLGRRDESCSNRYGMESIVQHVAEGGTERDEIINTILNLKRTDDVETKICLLERLSVMPIQTEQEAQVAMHVIKILQDCVIYYKLRRLPKELQAVVAHKLIQDSQERPTVSSMPRNIPSAAVSSVSLANMVNRFNSTGIYSPSLSNYFSNSATFNSVMAYSRSPMGNYAAARALGVSHDNAYNGSGSSTATVRPGTFQNFSDYRVSDLRSILNNMRNTGTSEISPSVSNPATNPFDGGAPPRQRPSTSSSFRSLSYSYRHH